MSNYCLVFDTETTDLTKCFCYDVGYLILDMNTHTAVEQKHFIIEQVWHNLPLFESAYYKDKRPGYVQLMRAHKATLTKWGYAMQEMKRDIARYNIMDAYAYNSTFDDKVFTYNCDWFKTCNPLDNVAVHDIWGYASKFITYRNEYQSYCEDHELFTDSGNYKGSAEAVYRFISGENDFDEAHMGLYDCQIEASILCACIQQGAKWATDYPVTKVLARPQEKAFTVRVNGKVVVCGAYVKKYVRNDVYNFTTREK